ncbi:MAG: pre-peptidase C-terminal domain-containing protein [Ruminococcus sp.]|nr:pre-peptidase C-terminal domain-containing protein [Ruminococcus sp.]
MRGTIKRAAAAALALIIFVMCAVSAFAAQEKEPNDTIVTASTISVNTVVNGTTHSNDSKDWYKFTINQDGYVWIDFTHDYGADSHNVYLYSYDGTNDKEHMDFYISNSQEKDSFAKQGLSAGTYYIKVVCYSYCTTNYSLKVNFKAANDWEKEFNDTIVTANTISAGKTVFGSTHSEDSKDWYKFTTNRDGYVWIDFTHDYGADSHNVYLYSYDGTNDKEHMDFYISNSQEKKSSAKQGLSAGTYYIKVDCYSYCTTNYSLKVNFSTSSGGGSTAPSKAPNTQSTTTTKHSTAISSSDYINITADNNAQTYQSGNLYYYIDVNYNIVINNYSGSDTYVEIPSEINGKPVIGIADNAFAGTPAQIIYVPSSVSQFGQNAFGQDDGESREIMCEDGSYAQAYADSNGIANETVADKNEASSNAAAKKNKAEKKTAESKSKKLSTPMIIIICVAAAAIIAVVVVIIVMSRKKNEFEADNGFKYKQ